MVNIHIFHPDSGEGVKFRLTVPAVSRERGCTMLISLLYKFPVIIILIQGTCHFQQLGCTKCFDLEAAQTLWVSIGEEEPK